MHDIVLGFVYEGLGRRKGHGSFLVSWLLKKVSWFQVPG